MLKNFFIRARIYIVNFLQTQLIVSIVSMPILVFWGVPFSKASFLGNFLFLPILVFFLVISSLIFFLELFHIPNLFFVNLLEYITKIWSELLCLGQKSWLYGFSGKNIFFILLIPVITFILLLNNKINDSNRRLVFLAFTFLFSSLFLKFFDYKTNPAPMLIENKMLVSKDKNGMLIIEDFGAFNRKKSLEKFVDFTVKPEIMKRFGTTNIDRFKISSPGPKSFEGAVHCCNILNVKQVYLPFFDKKLTKYGWRKFFEMKDFLNRNSLPFIRTAKKNIKSHVS